MSKLKNEEKSLCLWYTRSTDTIDLERTDKSFTLRLTPTQADTLQTALHQALTDRDKILRETKQ